MGLLILLSRLFARLWLRLCVLWSASGSVRAEYESSCSTGRTRTGVNHGDCSACSGAKLRAVLQSREREKERRRAREQERKRERIKPQVVLCELWKSNTSQSANQPSNKTQADFILKESKEDSYQDWGGSSAELQELLAGEEPRPLSGHPKAAPWNTNTDLQPAQQWGVQNTDADCWVTCWQAGRSCCIKLRSGLQSPFNFRHCWQAHSSCRSSPALSDLQPSPREPTRVGSRASTNPHSSSMASTLLSCDGKEDTSLS